MGRRRKYITKEAQEKAKKERQKRYYERYREEIAEKNLKHYHENKIKPELKVV